MISHASAMSVTYTSRSAKRPVSNKSKPKNSLLPPLMLTSKPLTLPSAKPMPSLKPTINACAPIATHPVQASPNSSTNIPNSYRKHSQRTKTSPLPPLSSTTKQLQVAQSKIRKLEQRIPSAAPRSHPASPLLIPNIPNSRATTGKALKYSSNNPATKLTEDYNFPNWHRQLIHILKYGVLHTLQPASTADYSEKTVGTTFLFKSLGSGLPEQYGTYLDQDPHVFYRRLCNDVNSITIGRIWELLVQLVTLPKQPFLDDSIAKVHLLRDQLKGLHADTPEFYHICSLLQPLHDGFDIVAQDVMGATDHTYTPLSSLR
ncbi:hypothetical protein SARC_02713 [Sphaeroforma arctica JP610]|uniref:Uncharacterized protein n=1 Tax=Sphaeroforma arctica JP610 TaxID=667725 RepID=A0A0L0G7X9_9EUKA|nr:hypothetical protein SARC_02713 [Sphaeroforma arctica JP610]KNC85085.1 hypothetical protein SARC_02713 [Sphaeroforma arctica JP610]|eukprot:XP_014158987.1 hypothetical protein SARC_02713 [Sphaeroforma arctica JP610]